jgi:glutaredoxin
MRIRQSVRRSTGSGDTNLERVRGTVIEIYYADICGLCHKALNYFKERKLPVTAYEVDWDAERDQWVDSDNVKQMLARAGAVDFVPQIFLHGKIHISGWKRLEPMIESGAFDRLLAQAPAEDHDSGS